MNQRCKEEKALPYLVSKDQNSSRLEKTSWNDPWRKWNKARKNPDTATATTNTISFPTKYFATCQYSLFAYKHNLARHFQTKHFLYRSRDFCLKRYTHWYGVSLLWARHSVDAPVSFVPSLSWREGERDKERWGGQIICCRSTGPRCPWLMAQPPVNPMMAGAITIVIL